MTRQWVGNQISKSNLSLPLLKYNSAHFHEESIKDSNAQALIMPKTCPKKSAIDDRKSTQFLWALAIFLGFVAGLPVINLRNVDIKISLTFALEIFTILTTLNHFWCLPLSPSLSYDERAPSCCCCCRYSETTVYKRMEMGHK